MKTLMIFCLVLLTISVRLSTARANHDNMETEEVSLHKNGERNGRATATVTATEKTDAAPVLTLSDLIFNKDSYRGLVNNLLLWVLFILTEYAFQFI